MKNLQKGFAIPLIIAIIAILAIGGGVYVYQNKKTETPIVDTGTQQSNQYEQTNNQNNVTPTPQNNQLQVSTSNWKVYSNSQYGFEVKYPADWQVLPSVGTLSRVAFGQTKNIGTQGYDGEWFVFVYSNSETNIDNMRKSLGEETEPISINGISASRLVKGQYESILIKTGGKNYWIHNGNIKNNLFTNFYNSFKLIQSQSGNTVSTPQPTTKIICSLSGNTIDDGSNQNGLTFFAQGQSCATLSGWAPNNPTNQSLTFNGVTKIWRMVLLSFYNAHFSPDGNHFAYTASNIPLPQVSAGGDWKPQRFIVSDNVAGPTYDDVYYPQYSQDGKHLGYCAYQDGQYMKIIDGVKTITTKDDYFATCDSLFGFKQGPPTDHSQESQGQKSANGSYTIRQTECSAKFGCKAIVVTNNTTGVSKEYPEGRDVNASNVIFSPDSKHFAWLMGSQVYVDGNWNEKKYDEAFNLNFSSDSKSVTYNARSGKTVYFITAPVN